jgi:hypothetical protein
MLFYSSSKVNKLVFLRRELYPMPLCLIKTALINLAKRSTVLLCALIISKRLRSSTNLIKCTPRFGRLAMQKLIYT